MRRLICSSLAALAIAGAAVAGGKRQPDVVPLPPPVPLPLAAPTIVALSPAPVMTVQEFAKTFPAGPGRYEVVLLHPKTCKPVAVCFELPCGCLTKVSASKNSIKFEYRKQDDVVIRFKHNGSVSVKD
jgi:hypothetical protein